jgi:hypothetical protein
MTTVFLTEVQLVRELDVAGFTTRSAGLARPGSLHTRGSTACRWHSWLIYNPGNGGRPTPIRLVTYAPAGASTVKFA